MARVLVWFPNSAVDHTIHLDRLRTRSVQRAREEQVSAGGKGANVLRTLSLLAADAMGMTVTGGDLGRLYKSLGRELSMPMLYTDVSGPTRIATLIVEDGVAAATVVNGPGPTLTSKEWQQHVDDVEKILEVENAGVLAICGSFPPGSVQSDIVRICKRAKQSGMTVAADVSGDLLREALTAEIDFLKINHDEAREVLDEVDVSDFEPQSWAHRLSQRTAAVVVVTSGEGAISASHLPGVVITPPYIDVVNSVGCGDAFLAVLVAHCARNVPIDRQSLRWATAVAAASAETALPGAFEYARAEKLLTLID